VSVVRTEEAALLRAVLGRPDDDVPRLVLADWLDEHGQPERAEFVRVQCEANRNPAGCFHDITSPPDCRTCALHLRAKALSLEWVDGGINWERWSGLPDVGWACLNIAGGLALAGGRTAEWNHFRYRCGFVESIGLSLAQFLAHAADLFGRQPITAVRPIDVRPFHAGSGRWGWSIDEADGGYDVPWVLPPELFGYLPPPDPPFASYSPLRRWYTSEDRAWEAVSVACVGYGRALNDLPPLDRWAEHAQQ